MGRDLRVEPSKARQINPAPIRVDVLANIGTAGRITPPWPATCFMTSALRGASFLGGSVTPLRRAGPTAGHERHSDRAARHLYMTLNWPRFCSRSALRAGWPSGVIRWAI